MQDVHISGDASSEDETRVSDAFEIKERGPCTVSGARTPSARGADPLSFCFQPPENRKRGETTKYPLNSFLVPIRSTAVDPVVHPRDEYCTGSGAAAVPRRNGRLDRLGKVNSCDVDGNHPADLLFCYYCQKIFHLLAHQFLQIYSMPCVACFR